MVRAVRSKLTICVIAASVMLCGCARPKTPEAVSAPIAESDALPLPSLQECPTTKHPALPAKWTAAALLHPFYEGDPLLLAQLAYDGALGMMLQTNEWADGAAGTWLITSGSVFHITGPPNAPTACTNLGPGPKPPGPDWLDDSAQCVGVSSVQGRTATWWKTRSGSTKPPPTTWYWFDTTQGMPWRVMFAQPELDAGLLGLFSFINLQQFETSSDPLVRKLAQFCKAAPLRPRSIRSAFDVHAVDAASGTRAAAIAASASRPKVDFECGAAKLPVFKTRFGMTTLMSSVSYDVKNPLPTRVYFDAGVSPPAMRTTMFEPDGKTLNDEALLSGGDGYLINPQSCELVLPGVPVVNWQEIDECVCRASISGDPQWNQYPEQWVIECPLEDERVFWMWYTPDGIPIVFMETAAPIDEGTSLALADYVRYVPQAASPVPYDPPPWCKLVPPAERPKRRLFHHASRLSGSDPACHRCHEPLVSR